MVNEYAYRAGKRKITSNKGNYTRKEINRLVVMIIMASILFIIILTSYITSINKKPSNNTRLAIKTQTAAVTKSSGKKKYEFYNLLEDMEVKFGEEQAKAKISIPKAPQKYIVQLAAFKDHQEADRLSSELTELSFESKIRPVKISEQNIWHHVYVGPFLTETDAREQVARLKDIDIKDGLVLKTQV